MFGRMIGRLFAAALFCVATFATGAHAQVVSERATVVVELYTSQGCSQCPRANRLIGSFSREEGALALTFPVSIWDYLGWRDTFATPEFTGRQRAYARALRVRRLTPQLFYNGARSSSASNWDEARAILEQTQATRLSGPDISITRPRSNRLRITLGPGARSAPADIWIVQYDPGPISAFVSNGVNLNRRVNHYNLVSEIHLLGQWTGEPVYFERTRCSPQCAVIVQEPNGGRVLSAAFTSRR